MSIFDDDRITIAERYATAVESSHLEVLPTRCSVDYLIAVGWCKDTLGTKLHRLRSEWDTVRAAHRADDMRAQAQADASFEAWKEGDATEALRMQLEAEQAATVRRALALVSMPSLKATAEAVHGFAVVLATRREFMERDSVVHSIAARALQLWIDPLCAQCDGRGYRGGFLALRVNCSACGASGNRSHGKQPFELHNTDSGRQFGALLLGELNGKFRKVAREIAFYLHQREVYKAKHGAALARQAQVLADLRSTVAQED